MAKETKVLELKKTLGDTTAALRAHSMRRCPVRKRHCNNGMFHDWATNKP